MDNELNQQGFYYQDLDKVAKVLSLICEGISAQRVSFNLKTITVIFSLN
jgi:hypothetical protein